jgi:hypothetical protein
LIRKGIGLADGFDYDASDIAAYFQFPWSPE